jgi:uncharacterized protein
MKYLITGGTGLVGRKLIAGLLADGHEVHNLGRGAAKEAAPKGFFFHQWDGKSVPAAVPSVDVVVNLAGASIGQRWSEDYKKLLVSSRVDATLACASYLKLHEKPGQVFISASGFNYYGDLLDTPVREGAPAGDSFMANICKQWEAATAGTQARTVTLRISVVLDPNDGPLARMLTPYKFGAGGPTGTGRQGFPWIHIDDLIATIRFVADNPKISGPVNVTSPTAIRQQDFSDALAKVLHRPNFFRLPKRMLELVFGEMSVVLWGGAFVVPAVLQANGFQWKFPEIEPALRDLLK